MKKNNIVLIGFCGVGKTTIAKRLSADLGLNYIDSDEMIKDKFYISANELFKSNEKKLRSLEYEILSDLKTLNNTIISTGGGFLYDEIKDLGSVIYLKIEFKNLIKRDEILSRPIYNNIEFAKNLHTQRDGKYTNLSDFIIDVNDKSINKIIDEIKGVI